MPDHAPTPTPTPTDPGPAEQHGARPLVVLIIVEHPLCSTTLGVALRGEGIEAHQVPVSDPDTIVTATKVWPAALAVLDLSLNLEAGRRVDPAELVAPLCEQGHQVVVLGGKDDDPGAAAAIAAGAIGTLPGSVPFETLLHTLFLASAGHPIMTEVEHRLWLTRHHHQNRREQKHERRLDERMHRLSQGEHQLLRLLAAGHRAGAIAERFTIPVATVRTQIRAILTALQVGSQLEAVVLLWQQPGLDAGLDRTGPLTSPRRQSGHGHDRDWSTPA